MREHGHAGHVADRPDALGGPAALVDLDPAPSGLDADVLQADALRAWAATGGDDDLPAASLLARVELDDPLSVLGAHADGALAEEQLDPVLGQDLAEQLADLRVLAVGESRRPLDDGHVRAEA